MQATEATEPTDGAAEPAGVIQLEECLLGTALAAFDQDPAARRLELLAADRALVDSLMLRGYAGPGWLAFTHALAAYAYPVMCAWIAKGTIFRHCAEKGIGQLPRESAIDDADVQEIAGETVAEAIRHFRERVLIPGKWDVTRGASLKTFFVGQCILRFANVYRRWHRELHDPLVAQIDRDSLAVDLGLLRTQDAAPDTSAHFSRTIERLQPRDPRVILGMTAVGYDQQEIAVRLGTTVRGIQSRLFRLREKSR